MSQKLLRLPQVRQIVGLSRSEIYRLISLQRFPAGIPLGERIKCWDSEDIEAWVTEKITRGKAK